MTDRIPKVGDWIRYIHYAQNGYTDWHQVTSVDTQMGHFGGFINSPRCIFYANHPDYPYEFRDPPKGKRKSGFGQFIGRIEASS